MNEKSPAEAKEIILKNYQYMWYSILSSLKGKQNTPKGNPIKFGLIVAVM